MAGCLVRGKSTTTGQLSPVASWSFQPKAKGRVKAYPHRMDGKLKGSHQRIFHRPWTSWFWVMRKQISNSVTGYWPEVRTDIKPSVRIMQSQPASQPAGWVGSDQVWSWGLGVRSRILSAKKRERLLHSARPQFHSKCQSSSGFSGASNPALSG